MERHFVEALKLALENKNKSFSYKCDEKAEGYVVFSTSLNKALFVSYNIPCSFTEKEALNYIKKNSKK